MASERTESYYAILEVDPAAPADDIRDAIAKQRTKWTNRMGRGGPAADKARNYVTWINEAETTLLDPSKRAAYDAELASGGKGNWQPENDEPNWMEVTWRYFDEGDYEIAERSVGKATSQQPKNPAAWVLAGMVYLGLKKYDQANQAAYEAVLLDEDDPWGYGLRADAYRLKSGNVDKAIEQYSRMEAKGQARGDQNAVITARGWIAICKAEVLMDQADNINNIVPDTFTYTEQMMTRLRDFRERLVNIRSQVNQINTELGPVALPDAQAAIQSDLSDLDRWIKAYDEMIAEGDERVTNWFGFFKVLIPCIIIAIICFSVGGGAIAFGLIIGIGGGVIGWMMNSKPKWKWGQ